jgi:membrane protease YdiL (CAAX protease family)
MQKKTAPLIKQGWLRALIYFILFVALAFLLQLFVFPVIDNAVTDAQLKLPVTYTSMAIVIVGFTFLMTRFIDRQSFKSLGFDWGEYKSDGGMGMFTAIAMLGLGTLLLLWQNRLVFTDYQFDPAALSIQFLLMVIVAFTEEICFRGYLLNNLMKSTNKWIALFVTAVLFGVVHATNPSAGVLPIVNIFIAGVLLGCNYIFTRNLWFAIFFHFTWDFMQGPILGYEVSGLEMKTLLQQDVTGSDLWTGGKFGFEGSLLCTVMLLVVTIIWLFLFQRKYEATETQSTNIGQSQMVN